MWLLSIVVALSVHAYVGISATKGSEKNVGIWNGKWTTISNVPYQVQVLNAKKEFQCSGAIWNETAVLVPKSCVDGNLTGWTVLAGTGMFNKSGGSHNVLSVNSTYNITLLLVQNKFFFSETVDCIPVAKKQNCFAENAYISGWGCFMNNKKKKDHTFYIRYAPVPITSISNCMDSKSIKPDNLTMICAGSSTNSACGKLDLGNPLTCFGELVGISLETDETGSRPSLYADLTSKEYSKFLEDQCNANEKKTCSCKS